MSLDEQEKKELAKKIAEQRRAMWKGEATRRRPKRQWRRKVKQVPDRRHEHKRVDQASKKQRKYNGEKKTSEQRLDTPKLERSKDAQSRTPTLKTALLVIIGLIGAIAIGMAIGYLAASFDLIKI